ncbi:MAG: DNA primase [Burkholderiales bacterium]|nr:DNA primase [Burkholderiales bacterium]
MIPESFKQALLARVDLVDVIDARVPLKKAGANFTACCPFHTEKTPSFTVSPAKQFYHCFGCGAHGNAISFLMEYGGLGYVEAVRELAESVGMQLPAYEESRARPAPGPDLYEVMERAAKYYRDSLRRSPQAIEYLKGRGLEGRTAARFGIGYAPAGWQNLEAVFANYADKALAEAGLVIANDEGRRYDRFRDRIMFPILDQRGRVIGFGGRVLAGTDGPKYLNSPETPLFEKGRELYGLAQAREAIRSSGRVLVVEGYMDVVMLAQHGVENAVATLGTATTPLHVQKLLRQAAEVVFCFDGDAAGRKAAWHALEVSLGVLSDAATIRFLFLPPEHDPDSFVRERGRDAFEAALRAAEPLSAFLVAELRSRANLGTPEGRARLVHEAKPLLKRVAAPALQFQLMRALADLAGMTAAELARLAEIRSPAAFATRGTAAPAPQRGGHGLDRKLERDMLRCLLAKPELARELPEGLRLGAHPEAEALEVFAQLAHESEQALTSAVVIERFRETPLAGLIAELQGRSLELGHDEGAAEGEFRGALQQLHIRELKERSRELERKAGAVGLTPAEEREVASLAAAIHEAQAALRRGGAAPSKVL